MNSRKSKHCNKQYSDMSDRIFSKDEVQNLIKQVAELEAERTVSGRGREENGLTIGELKNIASETGLDPELIEKAVSEMDISPPDHKEKVGVNREEIASEIWIDRQPDRETMDVLVSELNHLYGTTDDLNWWDNLLGTYEGKAKVKRTSNTMYSTRVLMQQQGDRFRIRVSKRQFYGMEWDTALTNLMLVIPIAVFLAVIGGSSSSTILGIEWPGIAAGLLLSLLGYPVIRNFTKRSVEKHKAEVKKTVRHLSELILQFTSLGKNKNSAAEKSKSVTEIEISDESKVYKSQPANFETVLESE